MFHELARILKCFLKDHVTLKTGVIAAENSAVITGINDILQYSQIENKLIKIVMNVQNFRFLLLAFLIVFAIK